MGNEAEEEFFLEKPSEGFILLLNTRHVTGQVPVLSLTSAMHRTEWVGNPLNQSLSTQVVI